MSKIALPAGLVGVSLLCSLKRIEMRRPHKIFGLLFAYILWLVFCSFFAVYPELSMVRVAQAAAPVYAAYVWTRCRGNHTGLVVGAISALVLHMCLGLTWVRVMVGKPGERRLVGMLIANTYGFAAGVVLVVCARYFLGRHRSVPVRLVCLTGAVLAGAAIFLGIARTAFVGASLSVGVIAFGRWHRDRGTGLLVLTGGLASAGLALNYIQRRIEEWFLTGTSSVGTLTGRTELWSRLGGLILDSPLIGYGPGAMRFLDPRLTTALGSQALLSQAHNAAFEVLVGAGFVGLALWLTFWVRLGRCCLGCLDREPLFGALFVLLSVAAFTQAQPGGFGMAWYVAVSLLPACAECEGRLRERFTGPLSSVGSALSREAGPDLISDRTDQRRS